jgi:hypothetical protein
VDPIVAIILLIILLLAFSFFLSRFLMKRAVYDVIRRFKQSNAVDPANARAPEDLGIRKQGLLSFKLLRDYKPMALQTLMRAEVVRLSDDGKLYLHEETLMQTNLKVR